MKHQGKKFEERFKFTDRCCAEVLKLNVLRFKLSPLRKRFWRLLPTYVNCKLVWIATVSRIQAKMALNLVETTTD